jgi:hypothetical protein
MYEAHKKRDSSSNSERYNDLDLRMGSAVAKNNYKRSNNNSNNHNNNSRTMSSASSSSTDHPVSASTTSLHYRRRAHHAGSWYQKNAAALDATLQKFLDNAAADNNNNDDDDDNKSLTLMLCGLHSSRDSNVSWIHGPSSIDCVFIGSVLSNSVVLLQCGFKLWVIPKFVDRHLCCACTESLQACHTERHMELVARLLHGHQ